MENSNKYYNAEDEKDDLSLKEMLNIIGTYWKFLWKYKWIVVLCGIVGGGLGLFYAVTKNVNYTATYVFSIESGNSSSGSGGLSSLSNMLGFGVGTAGAFSGDNVVELLKSQRLIEKALLMPIYVSGEKKNFMEYQIMMDSLRSNCDDNTYEDEDDYPTSVCEISFPLGQNRETFTRAQDSLLMKTSSKMLATAIAVTKVDKKLSYVKFSFISSNEIFAKYFADALLNEVSSFYIETKTEISRKNIAALQQQADSVRKELERTLSSRANYSDLHMNAAKQIVGVELQKQQMDIQIAGTAYTEMIKNIEVLKLDLARETPLIQIIDYPVFPLDNDKVGKLKSIIVGGFLGGLLSCFILISRLYIVQLYNKED